MVNWTFKLLILLPLVQLTLTNPIGSVEKKYCEDQIECMTAEVKNQVEILKLARELNKITPKEKCDACNIVVPVLLSLIKENKTDHFASVTVYFCKELKIEDSVVCELVVKEYADIALAVLKNSELKASDYCDIALGCKTSPNPLITWNITLPSVPKPPVVPPVPPKPDAPKLRILQLTDIHIDFEYQPGAVADCLDPLCCRNQSTPPSFYSNPNTTGAGYWGDYRNCDVPLWTVENMFQFIANNEDFDYVYWTGDLPPHNVWNQTKGDQLYALTHLSKLFLKYFPNKIIYPTLGNHEAAPCNVFPPPYVKEDSIDWLYSALATNWTATGLPQYLAPNISSGAFYTMLIRPGFRLVSLNMNYCAALNFWLFINSTDPLGQLEWFANVLQYAENHGEKVHVIGHIYPAGCLYSWSENYYRIVNRYENTIVGQFFGHSHNDQFEIFYDYENITRATNIAYISPSVTTFSYMNPGYRIYTVDGFYDSSSWRVLDHETKFMNITHANLFNQPKWQMEYTAKNTYKLENLFPEDWNRLIDQALKDLDGPIFNYLYTYFVKSSDISRQCDNACKVQFLCSFKQARSDNFVPCK